MKSSKQRRAEIKQQRLARAARADAQLRGSAADPRSMHALGAVPSDLASLARHNPCPGYGGLPSYYVDRPFRCRDCGAEEVWTARQQKWWYETVGANLNSGAKRCLACRRARRAELARARSGPGANRLGEEVAWLRAVPASRPDAATEQRVEAALASKWEGVRKVAIEVLGRWQRTQDAPRLRAWAQDARLYVFSGVRRAASEAMAPLLAHPQDDAWVLEAYAAASYLTWPWGGFVHGIDAGTLDAFVAQELARDDERRLANLCVMLRHGRRLPATALWQQLPNHPSRTVSQTARHALRLVSEKGGGA